MALRIVRVLLICITSVIIRLIAAENADRIDVSIHFLVEPSDLITVNGKPAVLHCAVARSREPISIIWLHNDSEVVTSKNHRYVHNNGSLIFHKVRRKWKNNSTSDLGVYRCLAKTSSAALLSRPAKLEVADISTFYKHPDNVSAYEGETVRLSCQLNSLPAAKITWTFQNVSINYEISKRHDVSIPGVLYMNDVRASDTGEYRCIGVNPLLNKKEISRAGLLTVNGGWKTKTSTSNSTTFISAPFPPVKTIRENELLILECAVAGVHNVNIAWVYKKSENSTQSLIEEVPRAYNILKKANINVEDSGTYTCIVSHQNPILNVNRSVYVDVRTPPIVEIEPLSKSLPLAFSARFTCKAYGRPEPVISWLHNGQPLKLENLNTRMRQTENELLLTNTNLPDAGIYQCVASNEYGVALAAAHLYINDSMKPLSPINVRCRALNSTAVEVTWDVPYESEGNEQSPIIFKDNVDEDDMMSPNMLNDDYVPHQIASRVAYTVYYFSSDGEKESAIPTMSKETCVGHLNEAENYTFYVRAFNGASGSDPSQKVTCSTRNQGEVEETLLVKPRGPPLRPSNDPTLEITQINATTYKVSWDFEKPIIGNDEYKVVCKKSDGALVNSIKVEFEQKHVVLYNLEVNSTYEVSLKIIVNGTEGDIATRFIDSSPLSKLPPLQPPMNVETDIVSSSSIKATWTPPADEGILYYIVKYVKIGESDSATRFVKSKSPEVMLRNVDPSSWYTIRVEAYDVYNRKSGFSTPVIAITPRAHEDVENILSEMLNTNTVRISWTDLGGNERVNNSYFISCTPSTSTNAVLFLNATRSENKYFVDVSGLKTATTYHVQIYLRNNGGIEVGSKTFTMEPQEKPNSQKPSKFKEILGVHLTHEQLLGVFIGIGISVVLIILCVLIICACKRRFDKQYRQVAGGSRGKPSKEKHEMKVLSGGLNGYRTQYGNGSTGNTNIPLLSNTQQSNGYCQISLARDNCKYYEANKKAVREEVDKLLNSSSPMDETIISTLDTTNERDHEGGDSGYCDRNHIQSPLAKDNDSLHRIRKCSDITVDDGFYESELPGVSGTSPGKLNTVV